MKLLAAVLLLGCSKGKEIIPIDPAVLDDATDEAEARASRAGVTGPGRTPYVLAAIAELTDGASVEANTALVANNAAVAADIATALAE